VLQIRCKVQVLPSLLFKCEKLKSKDKPVGEEQSALRKKLDHGQKFTENVVELG